MINKIFKISNKFKLKKEKYNIVLYEITNINSVGRIFYLHPITAIILTFFDGKKPKEEILNITKRVFKKIGEEEFNKIVDDFIKNEVLEEVKDNEEVKNKYNPFDYIIHNNQVDMGKKRLSFPLELVIHLTEKCDRNCIYCYSEKENIKEEITFEQWQEIFTEFRENGGETIQISGGDPLMYPYIFEIIETLNKNNIKFFISTKRAITKKIAEKLKSSGIELIQISLDTLNDDLAYKLYCKKISMSEIIEGIKNLLKLNIRVLSNIVATNFNVDEIPHLVHFLCNIGVSRVSIAQYYRSFYRHRDEFFVLENKAKELEEKIEKIREKFSDCEIVFNRLQNIFNLTYREREEVFKNRSLCGGLLHGLVIFPNGRCTICEQLPQNSEFVFCDTKKQSIKEIWNSSIYEKILNPSRELYKSTQCYDCEEFEKCHKNTICIRDTIIAYETPYMPDPKCPKAPLGKRLC